MIILELFAPNQSAANSVIDKAARSGPDLLRAYFRKGGANYTTLERGRFRRDPSTSQFLIIKPFSSTLADLQMHFSLGDLESL